LNSSQAELKAIGVMPSDPQLLMEVYSLTWSMDEFREKAGDFAPTLVLIEGETGRCAVESPESRGRSWAAGPPRWGFVHLLAWGDSRLLRPRQARKGAVVRPSLIPPW
jgi:hypothetical protein